MPFFKTNRALKSDARESLLGHLTLTVFSILLYMFATSMLTEMIAGFNSKHVLLSLLLSVIVYFVVNTCANLLRIGLSYIFLRLQFHMGAKIGDLFCAFTFNSDTAVLISAFTAVLYLLCMLPFMIAAALHSSESTWRFTVLLLALFAAGWLGTFYVRLRYILAYYLILDFPEMKADELIRGSVKLLRGHALRLLKLYLSFLPLYLLSFLSLGVAGLWVSSYSHAAEAAFYKDLMANTSF